MIQQLDECGCDGFGFIIFWLGFDIRFRRNLDGLSEDKAQLRHAERAQHFHYCCNAVTDDWSCSYVMQIETNTGGFRVSIDNFSTRFLCGAAAVAAAEFHRPRLQRCLNCSSQQIINKRSNQMSCVCV